MQGVAFEGTPSAQNINMLIGIRRPVHSGDASHVRTAQLDAPHSESEDVKASTGNGSHATHRTVTDLDLVSSLLH